ncbi:hypothetical protein L3C95_15125 [Chitinophaga filiformis]|nr:hypothetical protein [Chitinophaga filiformis]MCF6404226.1 hypothetical protein [Chitinophaga filiformis]
MSRNHARKSSRYTRSGNNHAKAFFLCGVLSSLSGLRYAVAAIISIPWEP